MKHFRLRDLNLFFAKKSFLVKCLTITFIFSFIFLIWFFFVFDNFSNKLEQMDQEIVILKNNKILLLQLIKQKSENSEIVFDLKNQIEKLYPNDLNLNQILNIATTSGLELINYGTQNNNKLEKIDDNLIPLSFKGTFHQILDFLTKIFENKKLFKFEKINIMKLQDNILKFECIFNCVNKNEFI